MCSEGGEIWLSAVMRDSLEPPIAPTRIRARRRRLASPPTAANAG